MENGPAKLEKVAKNRSEKLGIDPRFGRWSWKLVNEKQKKKRWSCWRVLPVEGCFLDTTRGFSCQKSCAGGKYDDRVRSGVI